ncbi:MAG: hypothetical protein E7525_05050 [Ruminococcaceae bacterium]|nr:hypothetical protein [Oscillospiraceae bacterium]
MYSCLVIDGFSEDAVFIDGRTPQDISKVYLPFLVSLLRFNGIETEILSQKGMEWDYRIIGKSDKNLIYLPLFSVAEVLGENISFIYTDSTSPESTSFRIASNIRRNSDLSFPDKMIFINALHDKDNFKRYSPIIVDNIRLSSAEEKFNLQSLEVFKRAAVTAKSICEHYVGNFEQIPL